VNPTLPAPMIAILKLMIFTSTQSNAKEKKAMEDRAAC